MRRKATVSSSVLLEPPPEHSNSLDPNRSSVQQVGYTADLIGILGVNRRRESVLGRVGESDGLLLGLEGEDDEHGAKDLFDGDAGV